MTTETEKKLRHGKLYICRRLALYRYLTSLGHVPIKTIDEWDENGNPNGYSNWLFVNSEALESDLQNWLKTNRYGIYK